MFIPNPQVNRFAYSAFPGKLELFFDKHSVFIKYLLGCIISELTLPAKLHTELEGLRGPIEVVYPGAPEGLDPMVVALIFSQTFK